MAIQNGRAITYQANPCVSGFSGGKIFAASMRGFEWSKFQLHTCSGCMVWVRTSERGRTIGTVLQPWGTCFGIQVDFFGRRKYRTRNLGTKPIRKELY